MFIHLNRASHIPIYLQIKESVRSLIEKGTLRAGERLPSTRQLSAELGINRMTVDAAFSQLEADGLITSHVGRGTFVNRPATVAAKQRPQLSRDPEALSRLWAPLFVDHRPTTSRCPP
jgi:DNA-binding GntR family transcriptional regulator